MSVGVDSLVGGAFSAGLGAYGAFGIVGGILGLFAAAQLAIARYLARMPAAEIPGREPKRTVCCSPRPCLGAR